MIKRLKHWIAHSPAPDIKYPLFIFGMAIVIHSGKWADIRMPRGWLVVRWRKGKRYAFYSPDGTPNRALWGFGNYRDF